MSFERTGIPKISEGWMAAPCLLFKVDRSNFIQSPTDRGKAYTEKIRHRKELRERYGATYKKHLNIPERKLGMAIKMSF